MLERALIDHGSPTLANMKVGSLFTSSCADATGFRAEFRRVQAALESRGVSLSILRVQRWCTSTGRRRSRRCLHRRMFRRFCGQWATGTHPPTAHWCSCGSAWRNRPASRTKSASSSATPSATSSRLCATAGAAADAADAGRHTRTSAKRCAFSSATRRAARHTRRFSAPDGRLNG